MAIMRQAQPPRRLENETMAVASRVLLLGSAIFLIAADAAAEPQNPDPIGRVDLATVPFAQGEQLISATYTPSGKVLVAYRSHAGGDERDLTLATMNDDGSALRPFFSGRIPERPKDNGLRFMVFPDDRRIFLGDFVIECATPLETCEKAGLIPVLYPSEIADGDHIAHRWSEMVIAPDNRHVAWTTLFANFSAAVFTGTLQRQGDSYRITAPRIVSTREPFAADPRHADGVIPQPVRGGEVKQFVRGGTALSLVGAIRRDLPDSVTLDLASGGLQAVTDTPGYTETTIFSPDERLGLTMTTRFSAQTDPAILGLMPRPYPAALNMGLSMFAYTYAVTGVRSSREGSIGPALVDIAASQRQDGYLGKDLGTEAGWVFNSPLSWNPDGKRGMWIENRRGSSTKRIRMVRLPEYRPGPAVKARATPERMAYASSDMTEVPKLADQAKAVNVKVYGRTSGYIAYERTAATISKTYVDFSDDGAAVYNGRETTHVHPAGASTYEADIVLAGPKPGEMKLKVTFGPLSGARPSAIDFSRDGQGQPRSGGFASYAGQRLEVTSLVP